MGILVADILNPYIAVLAKTIDRAARAKGFDVVLSVEGTPDEAAERAIGNLVEVCIVPLEHFEQGYHVFCSKRAPLQTTI